MKNSISIIFVIMLLFISCSTNVEQKQAVSKKVMILKKSLKKKSNTNTYKNSIVNDTLKIDISVLEQDNSDWTDSGSFYFLTFHLHEVHYIFGHTCAYWFPSEIIDNKIIFYWALNEDCIYDVGIKSQFPDINNPKLGQPFGEISMTSDTTLFIDYYYKDWINKINKQEYENFDEMFPSYFYKLDW